jgi:hypothetical protein
MSKADGVGYAIASVATFVGGLAAALGVAAVAGHGAAHAFGRGVEKTSENLWEKAKEEFRKSSEE